MNEREFLSQTLRGNIPAVDFCMLLAGISQTWDDLIDADKTVDGGQVNAAFWNALIALPANAFYRQHQDALSPNNGPRYFRLVQLKRARARE